MTVAPRLISPSREKTPAPLLPHDPPRHLEVSVRPNVVLDGPDASDALAAEVYRDVLEVVDEYVRTTLARKLAGRYDSIRFVRAG